MNDWTQIRALCFRLRISETQAMDALQTHGKTVISDLCVKLEDIADADVPAALSFLKARFAPNQPHTR